MIKKYQQFKEEELNEGLGKSLSIALLSILSLLPEVKADWTFNPVNPASPIYMMNNDGEEYSSREKELTSPYYIDHYKFSEKLLDLKKLIVGLQNKGIIKDEKVNSLIKTIKDLSKMEFYDTLSKEQYIKIERTLDQIAPYLKDIKELSPKAHAVINNLINTPIENYDPIKIKEDYITLTSEAKRLIKEFHFSGKDTKTPEELKNFNRMGIFWFSVIAVVIIAAILMYIHDKRRKW